MNVDKILNEYVREAKKIFGGGFGVKVTVKTIKKNNWNNKDFYEVSLENDDKEYTCWDGSVKDWKAGDSVEAVLSEKDTDRGKKHYIKAAKDKPSAGKAYGKSDKEMALNCATAIACKLVEKSPTVEPNEIKASLSVFYNFITDMIKEGK